MSLRSIPSAAVYLLALAPWAAGAQSPEAFRYQAVARDGGGQLVVNTAVGVQFQLHQGSAGGTVVYAETHSPTTNAQGLFTVAVGEGSPTSGTFSTIDWSAGSYFVEVGLDPAGGTAYSTIGVQQLLSVPYALQAKGASTAQHADTAQYAQQAGPPGNAPGEIRYWNGSAWVNLPLGPSGQSLTSCGGTLQWGPCAVQTRLNAGETPCQIVNSGVPLDSLWGKNYLGGLIAYLDPNTCQGFVVTGNETVSYWMEDSGGTGVCDQTLVGGTSTALLTGPANSLAIASLPGCDLTNVIQEMSYVFGPSWSLPSRDDLLACYTNLFLHGLGNFQPTAYWSSSEASSSVAWAVDFNNGNSIGWSKEFYLNVRGVKNF
ncbi:MAG: hypothetical protein IPM12_12970 [Flavobacteriales bacterium]|nr:hypothetical protein [Flavobacteriales bacterium]